LTGHGGASFDEARVASGEWRPHWRALLSSFENQGRDECALRIENGRRILRDEGVTCPVTIDGETTDRSWELDVVPFLISAEEWKFLAGGVEQRVRLLNAVLKDLYGTQRLVRNGFVPASLVYANPAYLRPCQGLAPSSGVFLHTYAVDLARGPDGCWCVLADRTQAPGGFGFAQEARTVTARVFPEAVREIQPHPISEALFQRREGLRLLARRNQENPTIALLTPGPRSETYFEHAYMARRMGFPLVEGEDLTVRDRKLFIKTLEGLRQVDVVLRRVNDDFCDPLELRGDSLLGVPGLVEAARARSVALANALGAGLLESPAFLPLFDALCRHLLGEALRLPSIPTWWGGDFRTARHVDAYAGELALGPALVLAPETRAAASGGIRNGRPQEWVAQLPLSPSRAPVFANDRLDWKPVVLRLFAVFDGEGYSVMPGGLCRILDQEKVASVSFSLLGRCKDVWVLPEAAVPEEQSQAPAVLLHSQEKTTFDLPSRAADNLFWLGRYTERLEQVARVARCAAGRLADDTGPGSDARLRSLCGLLVHLDLARAVPGSEPSRELLEQETLSLLCEEHRPGGLHDLLRRIYTASFSVRYRLSADTWNILTHLGKNIPRAVEPLPLFHIGSLLNRLILDLAAFSGMEMENMTRGHGWVFLDLGRRIERAFNLALLLKTLAGNAAQLEPLLEPALEIADSVMTYRRRHFAMPRLESVLDLLLLESGNPRSVAFQVECIHEHAVGLPEALSTDGVREIRRRAAALRNSLHEWGPTELQPPHDRPEIPIRLRDVGASLLEISDLLTQVYFSHVPPRLS
jgi:uncharacterized circularly permuted ATP-grasp superfamily protein/uncharacterized alpha-E superfamily protein